MSLDLENIAGTTPSPSQAEEALAAYPYFVWPAAVALKGGADITPERKAVFERRIACCVGNEEARMRILGEDASRFEQFYPDMMPAAPNTSDAIKEFMAVYGPKTPFPDDSDADFDEEASSSVSQAEKDETASVINSFLAKMPSASAVPAVVSHEVVAPTEHSEKKPVSPEEMSLSELVGNGLYADAIEIIERRSLNNPEKSIYFASQIRFLRKLMINENFQKH